MITRKLHNLLISPADYLPKKIINIIVRGLGIFWDSLDLLQGQSFDLLPPLSIRIQENSNIRASSYKNYGEYYFEHFRSGDKLKKNGRVLDIGCGSGIIAYPLTRYLNKKGIYEGFDINSEIINWCRSEISTKYPNFHFQSVDLYNGKYNPQGQIDPVKFKFPYINNYFDLVVLSSVFTHMLPKDLEHYLSEITRVLKKGGKCVISYLLIDPTNESLLKNKLGSVDFKFKFRNYRTINMQGKKGNLEDVIAYDLSYLHTVYRRNKLRISLPISFGYWSGRRVKSKLKQDIIVASKVR